MSVTLVEIAAGYTCTPLIGCTLPFELPGEEGLTISEQDRTSQFSYAFSPQIGSKFIKKKKRNRNHVPVEGLSNRSK